MSRSRLKNAIDSTSRIQQNHGRRLNKSPVIIKACRQQIQPARNETPVNRELENPRPLALPNPMSNSKQDVTFRRYTYQCHQCSLLSLSHPSQISSATCNITEVMNPAPRAVFQEVLIDVANGAKAIRYFNLASVSRSLPVIKCGGSLIPLSNHPAVALLYLRLDAQLGSRGEKPLTS